MKKTLATLILAGSLFGVGACKENPKEYTTIKGAVLGERYMPASGGWTPKESRYSFSLDTEKGRKTFKVVKKLRGNKIESVDAMIEPGTKIEVQIKKDTENQTFYTVFPDQIKVIQ